ncbi:DUF4034 domain-containing protein [uncultured Sulfitobacter sp.]|uniref:DUF4034 domain-containing protein n=1 Tax=uncultured Sulfitobacter sp. TaxID=191468 RepID=UPI00262D1F3C|nr:DUF4034 domain-containing protein [uncultured Sulfitobacter sp.]
MRAWIAGLVMVVMGTNTAQAQPVTVEALRGLVMAGDISAVEAALVRHQESYLAGDVTPRNARMPYEVFETTHPVVRSLTAAWLEAMPTSAHAQTAHAVVLYHLGWVVRGTKLGRETYPSAFNAHYEMHDEAFKLALEAYHRNRDLLAASDTVIRLANTGGDRQRSIDVLLEVMKARPNYHTLTKAFPLVQQGYGGTPEIGEYLCEVLAPMVPSEGLDVPRYCMIDMMSQVGVYDDWPVRMAALLAQGDVPNAAAFAHEALMNTTPYTAESAAEIQAYMRKDWYTDVAEANHFDQHIALRFGLDLMEYEVLDRAKVWARDTLEHDPYNTSALDLMERTSMRTERTETGYAMTPVADDIPGQTRLEYARRRVFIAPYNGDHWLALGQIVQREGSGAGGGLTAADPYFINAVHYGLHGFKYLDHMRANKAGQLIRFDSAAAGQSDMQGWAQIRQTTDRDADLLCPLIRMDRLVLAAEQRTRVSRGLQDPTGGAMEAYYIEAEARNVCRVARNSDVTVLAYGQPVELTVMTEYGSLPARLN